MVKYRFSAIFVIKQCRYCQYDVMVVVVEFFYYICGKFID